MHFHYEGHFLKKEHIRKKVRTHTYTQKLLSLIAYLRSDSLYVFSGDAFKCGVFLFVVNEGLHILFQMKLVFGQGV